MPTRSAAVLASGTANAAKLFVAALAFTSAYVGLSAYGNASSATEPAHTITLAARELPVTAPVQTSTAAAETGQISVSILAGGEAGCAKSYLVRSVLTAEGPEQSVSYGWRLARWSTATKTWRTYLVKYDGFAGGSETVEWRPQVSGNPGWYRVELQAGDAKVIKSDRFQVSC
ncbi:hypothetical protein [Nonomuraea zeae]|uniref:Uncharacterized protein n=1 Tax=Nonomuraea zeae TaxID=1642303 RepID=A0A5S4GZN0_9ACTN|nr:hypothetical protein [Nonomuraea zeae]TMR38428.1 hypothetical protein ETD85_04805 [Nonomuraea zeae]